MCVHDCAMGVALGLCMSIVSYSLQVVHVCQYICTYPKIDQVNLWCLLQHNISCGRSWNHQADKHGRLCVHMYMCNTLVCKYIYTLCMVSYNTLCIHIHIFAYKWPQGVKLIPIWLQCSDDNRHLACCTSTPAAALDENTEPRIWLPKVTS